MDSISRKQYPVYKILEEKSDFFCPAKWNELFLYLNHGTSNSCHHPIPHAIPEQLLNDPYVLHNTPHKLKMQQLMLDGHRPQECHMCWHVEDINEHVVSDRIIKSQYWQDDIKGLKLDTHYVPKFIEVVFDNYCNLTCSYCDSGQSSSWAARIHQQPLHLETDHRNLYSKIHITPGTTKENYFQAWMTWWKEIAGQVEILKISGGEPLLSKNFWTFIDSVSPVTNLGISINTNFSIDQKLVKQFIQKTQQFNQVSVSVSLDATGPIAEYARQGLDYSQLLDNLHFYCNNTTSNYRLTLQSTTSILNIWGLLDKFNLVINFRKRYPDRTINIYNTIVRFPECQSINLLPMDIKQQLVNDITLWLDNNHANLLDNEISYLKKIVDYLDSKTEMLYTFTQDQLTQDFKKFLLYYDSTAKTSYKDVYPDLFINWIEQINERM
jgi:organic radical activating enzyme